LLDKVKIIMKHSKIVLSGTAILLTVAGAFVSKANRTNHHIQAAYTVSNVCNQLGIVTATKVNSGQNTRKTNVSGVGTKTLYTQLCNSKLYTHSNS
jgi:hypothetical protein